jgi:hypothetical protein
MNYFDIPIAGPIFHSSSSYKAQSKRPAGPGGPGARLPRPSTEWRHTEEEKSCCWGDGLINLFAVDWQKKCRSCSPCCRSCFPIRSAHTHTHNTHTIESFTFFYFLFFLYFFRWPSISQKSFCQKKKVKVHTGKGTTIDPMIFNRS